MKSLLVKTMLIIGFSGMTIFASAKAAGTAGCEIFGTPEAPLTIEVYSDFECPYCAKGSNLVKQALRDYPGRIRIVYRNLPLAAHSNSLNAAKAFTAICLQSPSLANKFQDDLYLNQPQLKSKGEDYLYGVAKKNGVNIDQLKIEMDSAEVAQSIADDQQAAKSHNFNGTPSFMIGSEPVVGALPYTEIKRVIDKQLGLSF